MAMAKAFAELMSALGYEQFASQGGDWGGFVTRCLAVQFPHRCRAIHLNMISAPPPTFWQDPVANLALRGFLSQSWALTPSEIKFQAQAPRFNASEMGYHMLQRTKPQTIAYALQDSPTGLLAWILEKFQTWTDKGLPPPTASLRDHPFAVKVMTNIHIYYLTRSAGSAARLYKEAQRTRDLAKVFFTKVTVPTGVSMFEHEIGQAPKRWCLNWYDLRFWVEHPVVGSRRDLAPTRTFRLPLSFQGGHFAALEEPGVLVGDLRHFFGREDIRKAIFGPGEKIKGKI
jgi:pimeloyl-ACP methyl ester carboxylesterase